MRTYKWTNGKKEVKTFREVSNVAQGVFSENELMRIFKTDKVEEHQNEQYNTRFEEVYE